MGNRTLLFISRLRNSRREILKSIFPASLAGITLSYASEFIGRLYCQTARHVPDVSRSVLAVLALGVASLILLGWARLSASLKRLWNSWSNGFLVGTFVIWLLCATISLTAFLQHHWLVSLGAIASAATLTTAIAAAGLIGARQTEAPNKLTDPDLPISSWEEDTLARRPALDNLARTILIDRPSVVAVTASYGSGKSSVLNLLEIELQKDRSVLLVRFSSWLPGSQEALVVTLFNAIIRAYSTRILAPRFKAGLIRYARLLGGLVPKIGATLKDLLREPTQSEQFDSVKQDIQRLPLRVIVLLDDVDRMQKDELQSLFKLIRGASEFPNLTYVCAMDYEAIVRQLSSSDFNAKDIREYLEKFFPVRISLPQISADILASEFNKRFERLCLAHGLLRTEKEQTEFNTEFEPLWRRHIRKNLNNLRRLKLYFNRISSSLGLIAEEVNLFDLMLLDLVHDTSPEVYEAIYNNPGRFFFADWEIETWAEKIAVDESALMADIKAFLQGLDTVESFKNEKEFVLDLICRLFPLVAQALGRSHVGYSEKRAEEERRICHPLFFPRYFTLGVPSAQYSEREFQSLLSEMSKFQSIDTSRAKFEQEFKSKEHPMKRWRFLDRIAKSTDKFGDLQIKGIIQGVAAVSDNLAESFLGLGDWDRARVIVFAGANRFSQSKEIQALLEHVVSSASSDGFSADTVFFSEHKERNNLISDWSNVDLAGLQSRFGERMKSKYTPSSPESLLDHEARHALPALYRWVSIDQASRNRVQELLISEIDRKPQRLGRFVSWFCGKGIALTEDTLPSMAKILAIEKIDEMLAKYGEQAIGSEGDRKSIKRFEALRHPATAEAADTFVELPDE